MNYIKTIIGSSLCSLFLFVAMQKERVNRERKTRYLFAILRIAQALTGALRAVAVFYPSLGRGCHAVTGEGLKYCNLLPRL